MDRDEAFAVFEDGIELFVLNVRAVDALDEERSNIMRFPGSDRIMRIASIEFRSALLGGLDIFRLPHRASSTYVSRRFVDRVNDAGLRGFDFNKVWSQ